jgi:hypothetical protein
VKALQKSTRTILFQNRDVETGLLNFPDYKATTFL